MTRAPASVTLRAVSLPAPLVDLRRIVSGGSILAMFERSAYLDLDDRIVALASADLARGPLTITTGDFRPFQGAAIAGSVTLAAGELRIGPIAVDLHAAALWDPTLPTTQGGANGSPAGTAPVAREAAIAELLVGAPDGSIAALLESAPTVEHAPARKAFLEALSRGLEAIADLLTGKGDSRVVARAVATEIAGRGPGLTPSGDDLLIGILHALTVWPRLAGARAAASVRDLLVDAVRPRTTRISGAYLEAARHGWAAEPWHTLIHSFSESPASTRAAVRRLLHIGETSGADALTGFCWAWRGVPSKHA